MVDSLRTVQDDDGAGGVAMCGLADVWHEFVGRRVARLADSSSLATRASRAAHELVSAAASTPRKGGFRPDAAPRPQMSAHSAQLPYFSVMQHWHLYGLPPSALQFDFPMPPSPLDDLHLHGWSSTWVLRVPA